MTSSERYVSHIDSSRIGEPLNRDRPYGFYSLDTRGDFAHIHPTISDGQGQRNQLFSLADRTLEWSPASEQANLAGPQ